MSTVPKHQPDNFPQFIGAPGSPTYEGKNSPGSLGSQDISSVAKVGSTARAETLHTLRFKEEVAPGDLSEKNVEPGILGMCFNVWCVFIISETI